MSIFNIINPYTQESIASFEYTTSQQIDESITTVASKDYNNLPTPFSRSLVLDQLAKLIDKNLEELALQVTLEMGKTITDSRAEIERAIVTIKVGSDLLKTNTEEVLSTNQYSTNTDNSWSIVQRVPHGIVLAIVPFNFPINLALHKIIPSYAMGNSTLLKPHPQCYKSTKMLIDLCYEAGMIKEDIVMICPDNETFGKHLNDPRINCVSFTGGITTAKIISSKLSYKKQLFELGGNCALVVCEDGDIEKAVEKTIIHRMGCSGQRCTASKRVFVHESIYKLFIKRLVAKTKELKIGDPKKDETYIGPLVSIEAAKKVEQQVKSLMSSSIKSHIEFKRDQAFIHPTIIELDGETNIKDEIFGPIIALSKFNSDSKLIEQINSSIYGLQCGIFTESITRSKNMFKMINVGSVIINDGPAFRADHFPFGGVKSSGIGREGLKYAMDELSAIKTLVF